MPTLSVGEILPPTHNCCCDHVVDALLATPASREVVLDLARTKLQDCPHTAAGNLLEMLIVEWLTAEEVQ